MHIDLAKLLTALFGIAPDVARLCALFVRAKSAKGPGGKRLTDGEKSELEEALAELLDDVRKGD